MATATLSKWGNGQGVRIPKDVCDRLGVKVGTRASLSVDEAKNTITFHFKAEPAEYRRRSKKTLKELAGDWNGEKAGKEWSGCDVGAEVVE